MLDGLAQIDWSSLSHAYGSAEEVPGLLRAMASPDAREREAALGRFYGAVLHQGSVCSSTVAAMPFLTELAADVGNPGRAEIVRLLASICESVTWGGEDDEVIFEFDGTMVYVADLTSAIRGMVPSFEDWAVDRNSEVRRAAIRALAYFPADPGRILRLLCERLGVETGIMHRLLIVAAAGTLADRFPETAAPVSEWLGALIRDEAVDASTRLAAVAQQARCAPGTNGPQLVATALKLLALIAQSPAPAHEWAGPARAPKPAPIGNVPPQILDAFEQLDHATSTYSPITEVLGTLHDALGGRVAERSVLATEQLHSPDPGTRLDTIRMVDKLMRRWRGDHSALVIAVAEQLGSRSPQVSTEAARTLAACYRIAEPGREALAEQVAAQRAEHGPEVWAAANSGLRRAHQEAVVALARLGDSRALPSILVGLDSGVDDWRAVKIAGSLPQCRAMLAPRLNRYLDRIVIAELASHADMSVRPVLAAIGRLADPSATSALTQALETAVEHEKWGIVAGAADALALLGAPAAQTIPLLRATIDRGDVHARSAAVAAFWTIGGDVRENLDLVMRHLAGPKLFHFSQVADILGGIGGDAAPAVPHLEVLLGDSYEWNRIEAADALWRIVGEPAAPVVLDTVLQAWRTNQATGNAVTATLERMGAVAAPALPDLTAELAQTRRSGRSCSIENDEDLQETCHRLIDRLT